ncbi:MAG: TonB-dependent receptor [Acidobacteriia bacterium]|nr:TonB-dependent receptor [Terriglobia bacterium]
MFRLTALLLCVFSLLGVLSAQTGNGTITGVVTDPTGAVVAAAPVEVKNTETGVVFRAVSTDTGNFTVIQLPVGSYELTATVQGFKKYTRQNITISAGQVLRVDVPLEIGASTEAVTVSAESSLLKTETGDVAHNITLQQLQNLPILGIGGANAGSSGVRNPFNSTVMIPGVNYAANFVMIVNGAPSNTAAYRVEGLDNTNHTVNYALQENQPSADAIQEVAVQTSNYAAEFGQAGGGLFNITMKSGTNQYHGSGYEYFVNEDLNAAVPFTNDGFGNKIRPRNRRNDFGGTIGGPIWIPKLYDGHNRTFFFFSFEEFRESSALNFSDTVPTADYRNGDFSAISPAGAKFNTALGVSSSPIGTDALGRSVYANQIFDPASRIAAPNGTLYANPFPGNIIQPTLFNPVAVNLMKVMPAPTSTALTGNYPGYNPGTRVTKLPSLKLDHSIGNKGKLGFYWSTTGTDSPYSTPNGNADGLPELISQARGTWIHSATVRLNYDHTLTPTLLLHFGAGYSRIIFDDSSPFTTNGGRFDCASIGVQGCQGSFNFPTISSTVASTSGALSTTGTLGGMQQMGNAQAHTHTTTLRPSFNTNATWIHGSHTYKAGGEVWFQGNITAPPTGITMTFASATQNGASGLPANLSTNAITGFPFASFLLGGLTSTGQTAPNDARMGKSQWAVFVEDSWKVTRKLTLDYGLRWDYATATREQYGRSATLGLIPNPAAGGRIGAPIFEATCGCTFLSNYPYAIGPRLGFAYQINPKTVIRGGWAFAYGFAPDLTQSSANALTSTPSGTNNYFVAGSANALAQPKWPNLDPGQIPLPGQITGFVNALDRNAARPPRQNQWSIGIQREISRDFVIEASYVANRGVWWPGPLGLLNQISPDTFAALGLHPYTNPADNILLSSALSSSAVTARIGNFLPYAGYSTSNTLLNALRTYPQFSTSTVTNSPTGKTWYDSLQVKGTKRMTHGLQVNGTFTWSKALTLTREDFWNPDSSSKSIQATDQPFLFNANIVYQTPKAVENGILAWVTKDWQIGGFLQYGSGLPLAPPSSTVANNLTGGEMIRTGQPLFKKDLNCGCINPYIDQVLNPAAWANPVAGTWGPGPATGLLPGLYYSDFRQARRPQENINIGRNFRIKERMNLQIRAEFANAFNRMQLGNPVTTSPYNATNALQNPTVVNGRYTGGFGAYTIGSVGVNGQPTFTSNGNVGQLYQQPRQGTLIARFTF